MDISYRGGSSVVLSTKKSTLYVDPNGALVGLKNPNLADAVALVTEARYSLDGARLLIDSPGEYEVGDFSIHGIGARRHIDAPDAQMQSTIYRIETSELRIGLLGHIQNKLSDEQLEEIGVVDVLIIPVGGNGFTLDPHDASLLARQIDPKVVIPVHYEDTDVKYDVPQLPLDQFTHELNVPTETVDKYKIKNASALPEALSVVVINRS
jgi:hypothetical protein